MIVAKVEEADDRRHVELTSIRGATRLCSLGVKLFAKPRLLISRGRSILIDKCGFIYFIGKNLS